MMQIGKFRKDRCGNNSGFTMMEVIMVLVLLGIIAAVAVTRIVSTLDSKVAVERDILKTHLRYVQLRALSDDTPWGMSFAGSSYTARRGGNVATYNLPNENSATHNLPDGITVTGSTVAFDEWGSPGNVNIQLTMSAGGGTFNITKNTGFIP